MKSVSGRSSLLEELSLSGPPPQRITGDRFPGTVFFGLDCSRRLVFLRIARALLKELEEQQHRGAVDESGLEELL